MPARAAWGRRARRGIHGVGDSLAVLQPDSEDLALRRLAVHKAAMAAVGAASDLPAALSGVLESLCLALGWDLGEAWTPDEDETELLLLARWSRDSAVVPPTGTTRFRRGEGLPGRVWLDGEPLVLRDLADGGVFVRDASGLRTALAFPVRSEESVVGVLLFFARHEATAPPELLEMLKAVGVTVGELLRRYAAEAAIRLSRARAQAMLESSLDGVVGVDHLGRLTDLNAAAERMFALRAEDVLGEPMAELIIPEAYRAAHQAAWERHLRTGESHMLGRRLELEALRSDGTTFPIEFALARIDEGSSPSFVAYVRDLTEAKADQQRLEQQIWVNQQLQELALAYGRERDRAALVALVVSSAERLTGASAVRFDDGPLASACEVEGALQVEVAVAGRVHGWLVLQPPDSAAFAESHRALAQGVAAHAAVALDNLWLYEELRESEARANAAVEVANDAARRKDEFIALLGHELRNPLSPMITALDLLRGDPAGALDLVQPVLERQARHLQRLVDDLLDVSRLERDKLSLEVAPILVSGVLELSMEVVGPLLAQREHDVHLEAEPDLWVSGDEQRLVQVVTNLLTNAARYTRSGGNVQITATRRDDDVVLTVADDGDGIDPGVLERIFEPFAQGARGIERSEGGLGLGLALVDQITRLHGGRTAIRTSEDGTSFEVILPRVSPPAGGPKPSAPKEAACQAGQRVLLVDDNIDAADLMGSALSRRGYEARVCYDGPSALSLLDGWRPDVCVLDIGLPVMSGYELAVRLRAELGPDVTLIAVTGYTQDSDRERSRAAGYDLHLAKPVSVRELVAAMEERRARVDDEAVTR